MSIASTIKNFMCADHVRCDAMFEQAQVSVEKMDWTQAQAAFRQFCSALQRHLEMEESVLFLAFEEATGNTAGPTAVMRMEHKHMRDELDNMEQALQKQDAATFLGHAETLQILMGQHNLKEESMLYPMADRALASRREELLHEMDGIPDVAAMGAESGAGSCPT